MCLTSGHTKRNTREEGAPNHTGKSSSLETHLARDVAMAMRVVPGLRSPSASTANTVKSRILFPNPASSIILGVILRKREKTPCQDKEEDLSWMGIRREGKIERKK